LLGALLRGIEHHRDIDRWFHRSRVFVEGERRLRDALFETRSPKLLLFAHPAWEMCLDGAWLRARGARAVTEELAVSLADAEDGLDEASVVHHFDHEPGHDRAPFVGRMRRIVAAAKDGSLHDDYATAEGIAARLAGMRRAFGFEPPRAAELASWVAALEASVRAADDALPLLFEERDAARRSP
jgi:hypothetical protein